MVVVRTKLGKFLETDNDCHLTTLMGGSHALIFLRRFTIFVYRYEY